jgi:aryl-alcohol dehydrogenase
MRIQAAVTESKGAPFAIEEVELAELAPDEVRVRVVASGICHTDLIIRDQWYPVPLPAVLGHEGAGVVEDVGAAVRKVAPGDHVAMSYGSCGSCPKCAVGRPWVCHDFWGRNFAASRPDGSTVLAGADGRTIHSHFFGQSSFATQAVATERNVTRLDRSIPLDVVAPFGCGIQTGAGAVLNAMRPPAGTSIAVFGTGTVGLAAVLGAVVAGCTTIIGVDVRPQRLELARELGATHVVDPADGDPVEAIKEATGGVCGVIGAPPFGTEVSLDMNEILAMGRTVRGIVEGESVPDVFVPTLIELWQQGRFPIDRIMSYYDFTEIDRAAQDAEEGRAVKPVLRMG